MSPRSPATRLALASALLAFVIATPAGALPAPRLRALLKSAKIAVAGQVTAFTSYDDDRAAVVTVGVDTRFKGEIPTPPTSLALAEMHEGSNRPGLKDGARGLFFLRPAARNSYMARTLPAGEYDELLPEFGAYIAADSPAEAERQTAIMQRLVTAARGAGFTAETARTLTFDLLACDNPTIVEDGAAGVAELQPPLTDSELSTLRKALERSELPERVRLALVRAVGSAKLTALAPTLRAISSPPAVMEAAWQALDAIGDGLSEEALTEQLASREPPARTAALRELLRRQGVKAIAKVAPVIVQDPDPAVRTAGIDALGELKKPETLPTLERSFSDNPHDLRQHAARAILAVGGQPAVESLERLAVTGPEESQRYAVLVLMMMTDAPGKTVVIERLGKTHPNEQVRELIVHGLPKGEH